MKRSQQSTNTNTNTNTTTSAENSSLLNSEVPVKRTRVTSKEKQSREIQNDDDNALRTRSKNQSEVQLTGDDEDQVDMSTNNKPRRLQQPPAYISVNLMKIKMECDYNPVVRLKRELVQHLNPEVIHSNSDTDNHNDNQNENEEQAEMPNSSAVSLQSTSNATTTNGQVKMLKVQSEANLPSILNNTDADEPGIECNAQETEYPVICIDDSGDETSNSEAEQQQQQEEKVAVSVETDVKNAFAMEMRRSQKGKEVVEKLGEEIKKHSEFVIYLNSEKTEIQMSLQNRIDQLNLLNGQQQTNINALNSIITQQWTEINQLKPQVGEQQAQIAELNNKLKSSAKSENQHWSEIQNLNSKITLQQHENKELKSQVAKHKSEIAKLKDVFKSRAKNQQSTEIQNLYSTISLKQNENIRLKSQVAEQQNEMEKLQNQLKSNEQIQQSVENSTSTSTSKTGPAQNSVRIGDLSSPVLSHVFNYLDINSLKESRFVCRLWREEAGKVLLKTFYIVGGSKNRCQNTLQNWLKNSDSNSNSDSTSTAKVKVTAQKFLSEKAAVALELLKKFPWLGNSIRELKYLQLDTENLYEILMLLPNLQVLETKTLDLRTQQWLGSGNEPSFSRGLAIKLELLIKKLGTLKELKLDFSMTKAVAQEIIRHGREFPSIKNLELRASGMAVTKIFMTNILHIKNNNWTTTRFTVDVHGAFNVGVVGKFLLSVAPTLKHVKFILNSSENWFIFLPDSCFQPWTEDGVMPLGLNRVETLEISRAVGKGKEKFVLRCILAALRLPKLKKLTVDSVLAGRELEQEIDKWNSHKSAGGQKLASDSLEELEIVPHFPKTERPPLVYQCHQSKIPGGPWPRLKSLKCSCSESFDASFLSNLRNLERLELNLLGTGNYNGKSSKFQLRDLKNLKSFCLRVPESGRRYQNFSDYLIHKELKFMKSLQSVQFHRVVVDATSLKSALGPNVPIIFTN